MQKDRKEKRALEILETLDEGVYAADRENRFLFLNRAAERMFGRSRHELIDCGLEDAVPFFRDSSLNHAHRRVLAGAGADRIDTLMPCTNLPVEASLFPISEGVCVHLRDVRARYEMERELKERNATLMLAERSAEIGIWDVDLKTGLARGTPQFFGIMGLPPSADGVPMNIIRAVRHPDDRERVVRGFHEALSSGRDTYEMEYRIVRPNGDIRWIFGRGRVVRDEFGTPVRYSGVDLDVTERKQAERALADSEERLRLAQEAAGIGTWDWDVRTGALRWSDNEWRLHGIEKRPEGPSIELWQSSIHPDDCDMVRARTRETIATVEAGIIPAEVDEIEYRVKLPDGRTRWLAARGRVVADGDRPSRMLGVTADVTERRAAEDALARVNRELEERVRERTAELDVEAARRSEAEARLHQAQKMEAVGQLTGGVAHDFNNLLTVILGNLETVQRRLNDGASDKARLQQLVNNAMHGAQRAASLTQHLLAFSRRQPLNPKPLDANRLVGGMSSLLRRTLGESIKVESVLAAGLWKVNVDANQLESAILNLAVNARDAMPEGGNLTIETANTYLDEAYAARQSEVVAGQYMAIAVTDSGSGMSPQIVERAFEPFFTTKEPGRGTGLGLSQVYGFVKQSGGHVKIYSELGQGTTVRLYLPRYLGPADEVEEPLAAAAAVSSYRGNSETILVVDDDEAVRAHSVEIITELGYTVLPAADGKRALELLEANPALQLLFTDVGLPGGMNGRQLADEARRRRPDLKVLFTTGYARNAIVHDGRLDPGIHLLTKPFTYSALAAMLRDLLQQNPRSVLVVEDDTLLRMFVVETLQEMGYGAEEAGSAREALQKMRGGKGFVRAAIIDLGLPDCRDGRLAAELRALDSRMPILIATGFPRPDVERQFHGDKLIEFLNKPYRRDTLEAVLQRLGVSARRPQI